MICRVGGLDGCAKLSGVGTLVIACGVIATVVGVWRGYVAAREALGPIVHDDGDPTRRAIDRTRPAYARMRVRAFARRTVVAVAWLAVATYGLGLIVAGAAAR